MKIKRLNEMNSDPVNDVRKILQPLNKDFKVGVYSEQPLYVDQSRNTPDRKEFLVVTIELPDEIVNDEYSSIYFPLNNIFREVKNVISYCIKNNFKIRYMAGEFNRKIPQSEFDSKYHCDIHYKYKGNRGVSLDEDEKICNFEMSIDYL